MKGNPIINERLKFMQAKKERLLKMKKSERGNELRETEDIIARLKRWNRELEAKKLQDNIQATGKALKKASENIVEAFKEFGKVIGKLPKDEFVTESVKGVNQNNIDI